MHCIPSLLNIMFPCLVEEPISAKNNTKIFKVSLCLKFLITWIKIKTLVLSSTNDHHFSLSKLVDKCHNSEYPLNMSKLF